MTPVIELAGGKWDGEVMTLPAEDWEMARGEFFSTVPTEHPVQVIHLFRDSGELRGPDDRGSQRRLFRYVKQETA